MTKRITKINIDGEEYSVGDGGGEELEKLKKYVRSTPDTKEGTSAQFGILSNYHQTYIQIDSNINQYGNYVDNITVDNSVANTKPNININAKSINVNTQDFLLDTAYGKICLDSDNKMIRIGDSPLQENENTNVLTLGRVASYCLKNNNVLLIGKNYGTQYVDNSMIITDTGKYGYVGLKNSIVVGEDLDAYGQSVVMIGKSLKSSSANNSQQIIFGQYNKEDDYSVFQIGDGQGEDATHNLFKIDQRGKVYLSTNGTGSQGANGPGYVVIAPKESENSSASSCYPFMVTSSSGGTTSLFYKKQDTKTISSFEVSAKHNVNSIKLTSDEDGTKTVELSDPDAWKEALFTKAIKIAERSRINAKQVSADSQPPIVRIENLPKGTYLVTGTLFVEALDTNKNSKAISNAHSIARLRRSYTSQNGSTSFDTFASQALLGLSALLNADSVFLNSINVCSIIYLSQTGGIHLSMTHDVSLATATIKAWGELQVLHLCDSSVSKIKVTGD